MIKYWKVGTSAQKMITVFATINKKSIVGMKIHLIKDEYSQKLKLINKINQVIYNFGSFSTANQYLKIWEALGFIYKEAINTFVIATTLSDVADLIELSTIFIKKSSKVKYIDSYRKTIIINILVEAKILNSIDLMKKNICKTKGSFSINDVKESISKYEKKLSIKKEFVTKIKELYDQEF